MERPLMYGWRKAPFLKLLPALITGILLQWYLQPGLALWWMQALLAFGLLVLFPFIPLFQQFRLARFTGIAVFAWLISLGGILSYYADIRHDPDWFGHHYKKSDLVLARIEAPLSEKIKSFKAVARVKGLYRENRQIPATGRIVIYFRKYPQPSILPALRQGSLILLRSPLNRIENSGNPGSFDYRSYCLYNQITHQSFPDSAGFHELLHQPLSLANQLHYRTREKVLGLLRQWIPGEEEAGLAEALLIGYKDDLDKNLVQSYSNTGVVHIIAISGLHLGLIYWLLGVLTRPLSRLVPLPWIRPVLIISGLWGFSWLAGAQPSVLRSALMFSCMVLGQYTRRKSPVYNSLAASAFILLCMNPCWLWDAGFQLSYAAVLSIVVFMQPVYRLLYFPNKLADLAWKLNAVTISAQVLTIPVCLFHFKQFPVYFLLSNFLAVPLSSLVLLAEILLLGVSGIPLLAEWTGRWIAWAIRGMNQYVRNIESLPGAVWDQLHLQLPQVVLLYLLTAFGYTWLLHRNKAALGWAMTCLLGFTVFRSISFLEAGRQEKILVYQVPGHSAMDLLYGRHYFFSGDSLLRQDGPARNFHLRPARTLFRVSENPGTSLVLQEGNRICFNGIRILLTRSGYPMPLSPKDTVDLLVVSAGLQVPFHSLCDSLPVKRVVFDSSVPRRKAVAWKKECLKRGIPFHDVSEKGAFVKNLN